MWGKTGCTVNSNAVTAPDGTLTADQVVEGTGTTTAIGQLASTFTSGVTYVHRIFAKANTRNWIAVYWDPNRFGGTGFTYFDVTAGVVGSVSSGMTAFIRPVANGFYECVVIGTCTSTGAGNRSFWLADSNGGRTYTGNGVSSLYIWGASLQAGSSATQHVATAAATVAASADIATITNSLVLTDQCWVIRARTPRKLSTGLNNYILQVDDGTNSTRRALYYFSGLIYLLVVSGNVTQAMYSLGAVAVDTDFTVAVRFANNNFAGSLNGGAIVTDLVGTNPVGMTTARIGDAAGGGYAWNSTIKTIETRRTASDAELPLLAS